MAQEHLKWDQNELIDEKTGCKKYRETVPLILLMEALGAGAGDAGHPRVRVPGGGQLRAHLTQHRPLEHRGHHIHHVSCREGEGGGSKEEGEG